MDDAPGRPAERAGLRERKKQRTRQALATAALRLFAERGYEETTIADIAAAADVSPRTFFSYFPSKEDVVFAEIDDRLAEVSERLRRTSGEAPMETIRRSIVDVLEAVVAEHRDYGAVQVALVLERPGLRARALQRLLDAQEAIEALLRELCPGISEIDAVAASGIAVGGMQAVVAHCRREGYDPVSMRTALDRAVDLVENGLVSVDALSRPSPRAPGTGGTEAPGPPVPGLAVPRPAGPAQSAIAMRSRRKPRPLFSTLATLMRPICLVDATWVPPSACASRPTMSTIRTSCTSGGTRLVAVRMMSGISNASARGSVRTSMRRSASTSALHASSTACLNPGGTSRRSKSILALSGSMFPPVTRQP
ncbi:TetR/AcrR family transcriptional regulator [Actinomadura madurae]|nr:TetR family transcriptional regulator [Actinomadura madurae]MCQ0008495.1 TetR/AcrR family transcriptional regulator [Actinomadura madurae]MCQ0016188.1 TetR/AcrR family transcriptional regulator [Actinomadura madurae]